MSERITNSNESSENFRQIMEHGFIRDNLMTNHYPHRVYFPDITGGYPAVLAEMAVFSDIGVTEFLPAMPDALPRGEITGVCLYNFTRVNRMTWDLEAGFVEAEIVSHKDQRMAFRWRAGLSRVLADGREAAPEGIEVQLDLKAGRPVALRLEQAQRRNSHDS